MWGVDLISVLSSLVDLISVCMTVYLYVCYKWSIFEKPEWLVFEFERDWSIRQRQYLVIKTMDEELRAKKDRNGNIVQVYDCY